MTGLRPLAALVAVIGLGVAFYGGPLLHHAGLSLLATDVIQVACGALAAFIAIREIRAELAWERGSGVEHC